MRTTASFSERFINSGAMLASVMFMLFRSRAYIWDVSEEFVIGSATDLPHFLGDNSVWFRLYPRALFLES